jgi:hypothetical protein
MALVKFRHGKYKEWVNANPIIEEGTIIAVTDLPWYKSWFGLKPTRLKYGIGKTFNKTRFI